MQQQLMIIGSRSEARLLAVQALYACLVSGASSEDAMQSLLTQHSKAQRGTVRSASSEHLNRYFRTIFERALTHRSELVKKIRLKRKGHLPLPLLHETIISVAELTSSSPDVIVRELAYALLPEGEAMELVAEVTTNSLKS